MDIRKWHLLYGKANRLLFHSDERRFGASVESPVRNGYSDLQHLILISASLRTLFIRSISLFEMFLTDMGISLSPNSYLRIFQGSLSLEKHGMFWQAFWGREQLMAKFLFANAGRLFLFNSISTGVSRVMVKAVESARECSEKHTFIKKNDEKIFMEVRVDCFQNRFCKLSNRRN